MPKTIFFFFGVFILSQKSGASDFTRIPASQNETYQENSKVALMANDYTCSDELTDNPDANSAIPYRAALEIISKAGLIKEKNEDHIRQSYLSSSADDDETDTAGRLWIDYSATDPHVVTGFSLLLNESETNLSETTVHTLGKFNCNVRTP